MYKHSTYSVFYEVKVLEMFQVQGTYCVVLVEQQL